MQLLDFAFFQRKAGEKKRNFLNLHFMKNREKTNVTVRTSKM